MRKRVRLPKQPEWDHIWQGWTANYIRKNRWKSDPLDEFQDLMHDAYVVFRYVKATYPLISDPKHLMALYKTALRNELIDKAIKRREKISHEVSYETVLYHSDSEDKKLIDTLGEDNNQGYLNVLISELPIEVRQLLGIFTDDALLAKLRKEPVQSRLAKLAGIPVKHITMNGALCRLLGLSPGTDLRKMLQSALMD